MKSTWMAADFARIAESTARVAENVDAEYLDVRAIRAQAWVVVR